ncbi:MAG: DUF456 domain-containing protein [Planctomycetota bacterium]
MTIFAAIVVTLASLLGVALTLVTLPGIWIMVFVALACELLVADLFSWPLIVSVLVLAGLAELAEFLASAAGSKNAGGTGSGMVGSIVGGIGGMIGGQILIPIPIVGAVVGGIAGAGLGAMLAERGHAKRSWGESYRSGQGAAVGRAVSIVIKGAFSVAVAASLVTGAWVS